MARALDGDARRAEILDAAFDVFATHGYHALSVRELAQHLGATTGTLYHWFDGKPALFEAMLARQVSRQVGEALAMIGGLPSERRLAGVAEFVCTNADDLQRTLAVALDYHRSHGAGGGLSAALAAYEGALAEGMGLDTTTSRLVVSVVLGELLQRILDPTRAIDTALIEGLGRTAGV